jgi:hypothetical protein
MRLVPSWKALRRRRSKHLRNQPVHGEDLQPAGCVVRHRVGRMQRDDRLRNVSVGPRVRGKQVQLRFGHVPEPGCRMRVRTRWLRQHVVVRHLPWNRDLRGCRSQQVRRQSVHAGHVRRQPVRCGQRRLWREPHVHLPGACRMQRRGLLHADDVHLARRALRLSIERVRSIAGLRHVPESANLQFRYASVRVRGCHVRRQRVGMRQRRRRLRGYALLRSVLG